MECCFAPHDLHHPKKRKIPSESPPPSDFPSSRITLSPTYIDLTNPSCNKRGNKSGKMVHSHTFSGPASKLPHSRLSNFHHRAGRPFLTLCHLLRASTSTAWCALSLRCPRRRLVRPSLLTLARAGGWEGLVDGGGGEIKIKIKIKKMLRWFVCRYVRFTPSVTGPVNICDVRICLQVGRLACVHVYVCWNGFFLHLAVDKEENDTVPHNALSSVTGPVLTSNVRVCL